MAVGTALTTGALAIGAVFFSDVALRLFGGNGRTAFVGRLIEVGAAVCVILFGALLLLATLSGVGPEA